MASRNGLGLNMPDTISDVTYILVPYDLYSV